MEVFLDQQFLSRKQSFFSAKDGISVLVAQGWKGLALFQQNHRKSIFHGSSSVQVWKICSHRCNVMKNTLKKKLWLSSRISRIRLIEERQQRCWRQNDFDGFMQRCKILQLHVYSLLTTGVLKKIKTSKETLQKSGRVYRLWPLWLSLQRMLDQAPFHWQKSFVFQDSRDLQLTTGRFFEKFLRPDFLWKFRSISSTWDEVMESSIQLGIKMER